jgi:hypothetical protein
MPSLTDGNRTILPLRFALPPSFCRPPSYAASLLRGEGSGSSITPFESSATAKRNGSRILAAFARCISYSANRARGRIARIGFSASCALGHIREEVLSWIEAGLRQILIESDVTFGFGVQLVRSALRSFEATVSIRARLSARTPWGVPWASRMALLEYSSDSITVSSSVASRSTFINALSIWD